MRFGFYLNSVARLRDQSGGGEPEPAVIAALAQSAGVQLILVGWTSAAGLLGERDHKLIREVVHGDLVIVAPLSSMYVEPVVRLKPEGVVLVGSSWDGVRPAEAVHPEADSEELLASVSAYRGAGLATAVLVEPDAAQIKAVARCGATGVVLDAAAYSSARTDAQAQEALDRLADAAMAAGKFGLVPVAARGLNCRNVGPLAALRYIEELYAGRAVVARALVAGIERAVDEMLTAIHRVRGG